MKTRTKLLILSLLVTGMGAAFLWHFTLIHLRGQVLIQEPSPLVLWAETALLAAATGFGIYCWISWLRGERQ